MTSGRMRRAYIEAVGRDAGMVLGAAVLGWSAGLAGVLLAVGLILLVYVVRGWRIGL